MCDRLNSVLSNLSINKTSLEENIHKTLSQTKSQACLLHLIKHVDESREELYDFIQKISLDQKDIIENLKGSKYKSLFEGDMLQEFNQLADELQYLDVIYERAGIYEK